jgi:hypothetical protein
MSATYLSREWRRLGMPEQPSFLLARKGGPPARAREGQPSVVGMGDMRCDEAAEAWDIVPI